MPQSAVQFPLASIFPTLTAGRGLAFGVWRLAVGVRLWGCWRWYLREYQWVSRSDIGGRL
jgi:hypothetical protein